MLDFPNHVGYLKRMNIYHNTARELRPTLNRQSYAMMLLFSKAQQTILIFEKLTRPLSVKLGVPSSMKDRSVRYMPRYGMQGGSHLSAETGFY